MNDMLEMDPQSCPTSSPAPSLCSTPAAFWESSPTSSERPQPPNHLNYQRITFPWPQRLAQHETPGRISDSPDTKLERRLELLQLLCTRTGKAIDLQTEPPRRKFSQETWLTWCLPPILTLVWVQGAKKISLLSATQRVLGLPWWLSW